VPSIPDVGDELDGFRVEEKIHVGGMGVVYGVRAREDLGFPLVMKVPRLGYGEPPETIVTYEQEQLVMQALRGPHAPRYVFSGHVHEPVLYYMSPLSRPMPFRPIPGVAVPVPARRQWLAIVGSAGQPRDGSAAACYALLDQERSTLTFHRVPYDWSEAARKITAAGLPERLALRLARGE
jgi:diadenosine tetraphosphatase ApaH/serine/threonine PP2A family protein phosphatase